MTTGTATKPTSSITANGPIQADGSSPAIVTIKLYDGNGDPQGGTIPLFTATDTGGTNVYGPCQVTPTLGVYSCTLTSSRAETKQLQITYPSSVTGGEVVFHAGDASAANSSITGTQPTDADGVSTAIISITLIDAGGNPLVGAVPSFIATNTGGTNGYGACLPSSSSGVSTCTLTSMVAEPKTLQVVSPISFTGDTITFEAGAPAAVSSTIFGTGPVVANGVATSTVTVTLRDAGFNPTPGYVPTFSATDTGTTNAYTACSISDAGGVSICTMTSTKAETKTLSITSPVSKAGGTVVFQAGAPVAANSNITGTTPTVADGVSNSTISITLRDAFANVVPAQTPTFGATGTGNTPSACGATNALGVSTCTLRSTVAETKVLSITAPFVKTDGSVVFVAGLPAVANSSITGSGPVVADGSANSVVTITLIDAFMNPVVGTVPTFSATDTGASNAYGVCSASDAAGVSTCALTSQKAETKTLSIATPIVKADGTVLFEAGAPVAATSTITGTSPVIADGVATSTITLTLRDAFSNPVPGEAVTFSATDTGSTNAYGACSVTDAAGAASCTLTSTRAESKILSIASPVVKADASVVFQAGVPVAVNSSITGTGPVVANGVATSVVTINLRDAFNNPVAGTTPTFTASDVGSTNAYGACSASDTNGDSTCTLASLGAETKTLEIATPVSKTGGTVEFTPGAAVAANSTITGTGPVVANGVATSTITVTLRDAANNLVPGITPDFSATDTGSTNAYGACSATDVNGEAVCTLASLKAEDKILSITSPFVKADGTVTFIADSADVANSSITGTGPVIADNSAQSTVTITLRDSNNNPLVGTTPTFSATDTGSGNAYGACAPTDAAGISSCTLQSSKAELKTLSIATPIVKADGTVLFIPGAASAATTTISGTTPVVANGVAASTITITILDAFSNPRSGDTPIFNATDTSSTNAYGSCSVTDASGVSLCTLSSLVAESKTLQLTSPVAVTGSVVVFEPDAASAANSTIIGSGPVIANGVATSTVTVTLRDTNNNSVVGVVPTFSATDTGTTNAYGVCSATNASGVSTCTLTSTKAETKTLAIVTPISKTDGTVDFTPGPVAVATSTITGSTPTVADGTATSTVTISLLDAFSNPVPGTTPTFSATDTASGNTYGACSATDATGESTCTLASTKAETKTLVIATPIVKVGDAVEFTAGVPVAANSSITGTGPVAADGTATSTVSVTLRDINNNPVPGLTPTFGATDTDAANVYGACTATDATGLATCTLASTKAETKVLAIATPVVKIDGSVVFTAAAASVANSSITGTGPVTADGTSTSTVTITLKDAFNNSIIGTTPTFTATNTGTTNAYGACSPTDTNGVSTCTLASLKAESKTLSLATPIIKADGIVVFTAGAPVAATSLISGTGPVTADGVATSTISITLQDSNANPVSGVTPTFSATDTGTTNAYGACGATDLSGVATCTLASTKAELKTLAIVTPVAKADGTVTFVAGAPAVATSSVTGTGPVVANGVATSTISVTLQDAFSNAVSGIVPTFSATDTGATNTYGVCGATNGAGVATCTLASQSAETKTLSIVTPISKSDGTVVFTPGAASIANSTITGTGPVVADGTATSSITITLRDAFNNPLSTITPTFSATDTDGVNTYGACSATNGAGVATCTLASTRAEVKTLSIATPISKSDGTVTFTAGAPAVAFSSITGSGPVVANGVATSTVSITIKDAHDNPVSGEVPTFSSTDTGTTNTYGACGATNASGVATCTLASTKAEVKTLAIDTPVVKSGGTVTFIAGPAAIANSSITGTGPVSANGSATSAVTIILRDAFLNNVIGTTPTFSATDTGASNVYGACSATDTSGTSTCTLASSNAETKTLSIATPIVKSDGTVVFQPTSPVAANSTITGSGPVVANGVATSTVTITLRDISNNPVAGVVPTFGATDTGTTNSYGVCSASSGAGVSTCTLASTKAETKTLSIATPFIKADGTVVFTAGSPVAATSTITGTGPVVANGSSTSTVTVTLLDAFSNTVSGIVPTFTATDTGTTNAYGACSSSDASGISTCTLSSTVAESKTLSIATPFIKADGVVDFVAGAAVAANSTITGTGPVTANGSSTSTVTITLRDVHNNNVTGIVPTFTATNTGTTNAYGVCSSTDASGVSTCTLASATAETKTLSIATPVVKADGTVVFEAAGADAANSTIAGTGSVTANGVATSTVTITLKDANNNSVTGVVPTFGATDTGSTNTYGTCSATNASGVSTCTLASTKAEVKTLSIVTPVAKAGGTVTFTPGSPSSTTTTIAGTGPVTANGVATSFITITILDAFSNPISGTTPIYNATNTGTTNTYGACSASNASGVSSCTLASTKAETKTLQLTSPVAVTGGTVVFQAGAAAAVNSTIAGTGPVTADGTSTSTVTITLQDAFANPVPGQTPTFNATNTGAGNVYGACTMGDTFGVSSCTLASTQAETKTLAIATPVVKSGGTVVFEPGLVSAANSTIAGTSPVLADGATSSTVTITLRDAGNNPVSGQLPEFDASGTGNVYDECSVSNASGVSTCTMQSTTAEVKTLQITSPVTKLGGTVTFTADSPAVATSTIVGTTPVVADGTATSTVTITLRDANSNPVSGIVPTFSSTGTNNTLGTCSSTDALGVSTCTLASTRAEVKTISLATPLIKAGNAITFVAGAAVAANSNITGTGPISADGTTPSTITVTLRDINNNNLVGTVPTFSSTGTGNTLGLCSATNASGVSTCTLRSSVAETKTLAIVTPVAKTGGTVVFQSGGPVAANSTIVGSGPITADGTATSTVTITLRDISNNPVPAVVPEFEATDTGAANTYGACSASNASGISTCTLASTKAEVKTLSITTPIAKTDGTVTFNPGPASALTSTIDGTSPTLANGTDTAGISITLMDANSNPIIGTVPTFTASGTLNTLGTCSATDSSGVSTCTLRSTKAEGKTIALATPVAVPGTVLDFNPNGIDIQVPIEMIARGLIGNTAATIYNRSRTSLNTDDYVAASNRYFFEFVAHNTNATNSYNVSLYDGSGAEIPDSVVNVPANITVANMTRFRVEFTPNEGADTYRIRLPALPTNTTLYIHSARIIVEQDNATDTRIYIPLANFDQASDHRSDPNGTVASTTSTAITTSATYMSYWQRDDSAYDAIAPGNAWTFEAVLSSNNAAGATNAYLFNNTTGQQVAVVGTTGTTVTMASTSFASNATNFVSGNRYDVRYRSNNTSYTTRLQKAGLWVKLKYLKKTEILQRLSMRRSATTGTVAINHLDGRALWEADRWTNPTVYFQTVGSGTGSAMALYNASNTDFGVASETLVTSITGAAAQGIQRSAALTMVDGDRYFVKVTRTTGTALIVSGFLVIQATE